MDFLVVKLGGSTITDKNKEFSVRKKFIKKICEDLASVEKKFILVHGGGSFGHPVASEYDIASGYSDPEQLIGFSKTHRVMEKLNSMVTDALLEAEKPAAPVQTSACTVVENDEIVSMELQNIQKLLELDIVPVLYGDSVPDLEKGMTILSGDQLTAFLAREMGASRVILGVDIDGVYTSDPKKNEDAELIPKITPKKWKDIESSVDFPSETDVTGGMKNKVKVLLKLAEKGIESQIVNAMKPEILKRAIRSDKRVGTKITKE